MTTNEKIEEQLNILIRMHEDRIKVYENAMEHIKDDPDALTMLDKGVGLSEEQVKELSQYVNYAGGTPETATSFMGKLYRGWIELLETFTGPQITVGLRACAETDESMIRAYTEILEDPTDPSLSQAARQVLQNQRAALDAGRNALTAFTNTSTRTSAARNENPG